MSQFRLACSFKPILLCTVVSLCIFGFFSYDELTAFLRKWNAQADALPSTPPSQQDPVTKTLDGGNDGLGNNGIGNDGLGNNGLGNDGIRNNMSEFDCSQNSSEEDIKGFSKLLPHIRDFLLYRHCRHFRLLQEVPEKCRRTAGGSEGVFLLVAIKTSPGSYDRREALRRTWAAERLENGAYIRRVFLVGTAGEPGAEARWRTDELLQVENRLHGDVLQWDFLDSFFNLTLKQLLFVDWMRQRCPHARFVLNGDDDIFANTDNIVRYLQALDMPGAPPPQLYMGQVLRGTNPVRWPKSKYYIPSQVYADKIFPPYCTGGGFLISGSTIQDVYNASSSVPLIPIDDAYIGLCLEKAGLQPRHHEGFLAVGKKVAPKLIYAMDPCLYRDLFLVHGFQTYEILVMWEKIHNPELKCAIADMS